jgi:acetoin utilization deacetylase AcuC-like enzyme
VDAAATAVDIVAGGDHAAFASAVRPAIMPAAIISAAITSSTMAAAAQAFRDRGYGKVAVLDIDYHHGNGTQDIFYDRADVLTVSIHADPQVEYPYYSGYAEETGEGAGADFNLNLPLPWGTEYTGYAALATGLGRIAAHGTEALVVSLGVDTFGGDPISHFKLVSDDFTCIGQAIGGPRRPQFS